MPYLDKHRGQKDSIGFVPTMGALHPGHISLVQACRKENTVCVTSIFINPAQFNNSDDFRKYPVTIEKDIDMLEEAGCDILFLPSTDEIYPPGINAENYDIGPLETVLEGEFRPGHFQGVAQVVDKLLAIVLPDNLYLGQKDFQQCMVIRKLIADKKYTTTVHICPIIREADGLAMSSRNMRLNETQRKQAIAMNASLHSIKNNFRKGSTAAAIVGARNILQQHGFKTDYVAIVDASDLSPIHAWDGKSKAVALVAAYIDDIRLIDNMYLN